MQTIKFDPIEDTDALQNTEGTVLTPRSEGEYPYKFFTSFLRGTEQIKQPLITKKEDSGHYELDVEGLAMLIWEHQQYTEAQEFSRSRLDVLHAMQDLDNENSVILPRQIKKHPSAEECSSQVVSNALTKLTEYNLIENVDYGMYKYTGFDTWNPNSNERDRDN